VDSVEDSCARGRGRAGVKRDATRTEVKSKHEERERAARVVAAVRADCVCAESCMMLSVSVCRIECC